MINDLNVLNDRINSFVNYIVKTACESTTQGNYFVNIDNACALTGLSRDDFEKYKDLVITELAKREEILEFDFDDNEFDLNCALDYCPSYQWQEGDSEIFKCTYDEWLEIPAKPVSQPLSLSRMAEIGENAIAYVVETSDVAIEDLTESIGMSMEELRVLGIYDGEENEQNLEGAPAPILFFVVDAHRTYQYGFESFEEALAAFEKLGPGIDKSITYSRFVPGEHIPRGDILLKHFPASGRNAPGRLDEFSVEDPHVKLAYSKAYLSCYPFDERAWKMRDEVEKVLGITDRVVDISNDFLIGKWRVHIVPVGGRYGLHNALVNDDYPKVEFYDMSQDKQMFPDGQFASSYAAETLLERDFRYGSLNSPGLNLDDAVPGWSVTGDEMREVLDYLRENINPQQTRKQSLDDRIQNCEQRVSAVKESSLPDMCYVYVESKNAVGVVRKGELGYHQTSWGNDPDVVKSLVDMMNEKLGVSKGQAKAMKAGSLLGWNTPLANPKNYDENGNFLSPDKTDRRQNSPELG